MKIKACIVEDNVFMATVLSDLLRENHPEVEILNIAVNGKEAIEKITKLKPELIFLDIEMPDMTGFEMLDKLDEISFQTVFVTAHTHYAIKAFRFNALDYLLKPIDAVHLAQSMKRFKSQVPQFINQNKVKQALENLHTEKVEDQKLMLASQTGGLQLKLKRIVKIEGERNYSILHITDGSKKLSSKTLGHFEDILSDKGFFRCHRSFLINRYHISRIRPDNFTLEDQSTVPISRRKKKKAKAWFENGMSENGY
jgi:two-component system LytT family response regulator